MATRITLRLWLKLAATFFLCTGTLVGFFYLLEDRLTHRDFGEMPVAWPFFLTAAVVSIFTAFAIKFVLAKSLSIPKKAVAYVLAYNLLIVVVKFILAPLSLYATNSYKDFSLFWRAPLVFIVVGAVVFMVYDIAFSHIANKSLQRTREGLAAGRLIPLKSTVLRRLFTFLPVIGLMIFITATGGRDGFAISILLLPSALEYPLYVVPSVFGFLGFAAVYVAAELLKRSFESTAEQAVILRDATLLMSLFWVGLWFLAAYHAIWIVFMIGIVTIWPLSTVSPE